LTFVPGKLRLASSKITQQPIIHLVTVLDGQRVRYRFAGELAQDVRRDVKTKY
jgi:hypothetical protein